MCGHSPLRHLNVPNNHRQETAAPVSGREQAPSQADVAARPCPHCGGLVQEDFVFCPRCGAELLTACPECHRAVEAAWSHCAYCGAELTPA